MKIISICIFSISLASTSYAQFTSPIHVNKPHVPNVHVPPVHVPPVHLPTHIPNIQTPHLPQVQTPHLPNVNTQLPRIQTNIPQYQPPQIHVPQFQPPQFQQPQMNMGNLPSTTNTPVDPRTWNQTLRNVDEQRRMQMDNNPIAGRDYTKIYIQNTGITAVKFWILTSRVPINGESTLGDGDNNVLGFYELKPGQKVHAANTPDKNFFIHLIYPATNRSTQNIGSQFYVAKDEQLWFADIDMGKRYQAYTFQIGESKEEIEKIRAEERQAAQAENLNLQQSSIADRIKQRQNRENADAANRAAAEGARIAAQTQLIQAAANWVLPPHITRNDVKFSTQLGLYYYPVQYSNGTVGARVVQVIQNSPLAPIQFDQGDTIFALNDMTFGNLRELDYFYDRTKVSFLNIRTNESEARWVDLPPQ